MKTNEDLEIIIKHLGYPGRMIAGSKGQYRYDHPLNFIVFNANIIIEGLGKIWHGDVDVTIDEENLLQIAKELSKKIYLFYEGDARFENEKEPRLDRAVLIIDGSKGTVELGENIKKYIARSEPKGAFLMLPPEIESEKAKVDRLREIRDSYKFEDTPHSIEIGDVSKFKSKSKKNSPFDLFWKAVLEEIGSLGDEELIRPWAFYLHSSDYQKLKDLTLSWIKVTHAEKSPYRLESSLTWYLLDIAPSYYEDEANPDYARSGTVYYRTAFKETKS